MDSLQNKKNLDRAVTSILMILNTLFLVYWGFLAYYSRLHYDDLYFLWKMREMSVLDFIKEMYFDHSGRFVAYAVNGVVSIIIDMVGFHQFWAILYYAIGLCVCWLVVKDVHLPITRWTLFMGLCFAYNLFVLTNIDFPVFYWICAMPYYLFFPLACLILKYLNMEKLSWWKWAVLLLMAVLIGGGHEAFTPVVLLLMFVCGMYWWHSKAWNIKETWALPQVRRIVWIAMVILVLFVVVVAAPGNYARMERGAEGEGFAHPYGILGWIIAEANAVGMFFYFMCFYIPYYLVAFVLAYYWGSKTNVQLPMAKWRLVLCLATGFIVYLLFSSLPNVYLYNGFGIQRNYTHVVCALVLTVMLIGFVLGVGKKSIGAGWSTCVGCVAFIVIMCVNIFNDYPTAKAYGKAVDERIEHLSALRDLGQKETVEVAPLPVPYTEDAKHFILHHMGKETPLPVLYYISETGKQIEDNEYEHHMRRALNLDFDFVLAE